MSYLVLNPFEREIATAALGHEVQEGETLFGMEIIFAKRIPEDQIGVFAGDKAYLFNADGDELGEKSLTLEDFRKAFDTGRTQGV